MDKHQRCYSFVSFPAPSAFRPSTFLPHTLHFNSPNVSFLPSPRLQGKRRLSVFIKNNRQPLTCQVPTEPTPALHLNGVNTGKYTISILGFRLALPGRLVLFSVAFMWASYPICLKILYALPWSISAPLFNSLRLALSAFCVLPTIYRQFKLLRNNKSTPNMHWKQVAAAGFELGFYTFMVNVLHMFGLRHTTASRGAFLGQLSTIIVPIAAFIIGLEPILRWNTIVAAGMALAGVALLTLDGPSAVFSLQGEGVMLCTAFMAALYILRSKMLGRTNGPVAELKVAWQAIFALAFLGLQATLSGAALNGMAGAAQAMTGATPLLVAANVVLVVWAGLVVSLLSTIWQLGAQTLVSASEAVVIFSLTPLCVAVLAVPLGERFGLRGVAGAALILTSTLLASRTAAGKEEN